jgi:hypothetical protein
MQGTAAEPRAFYDAMIVINWHDDNGLAGKSKWHVSDDVNNSRGLVD